MKGKFVGKDCELYIVGSEKSYTAWKVMVFLPEQSTWSSLESQYFDFKEKFQSKYGKGDAYEFFSKPYYEGDGYELQALDKDKCSYATYLETDKGYVTVEISKYKSLQFNYEDSIGTSIMKKEKNSIIEDDI